MKTAPCATPRNTSDGRADSRRKAMVSVVVAMLCIACLAFTACDSHEEQPVTVSEQVVMFVSEILLEDNGITVFVTFTVTENPLGEFEAECVTTDARRDAFGYTTEIAVTVDNELAQITAKNAVAEYPSADGIFVSGGLKIVYYYDTINKNITSNGVRITTETGYRHILETDATTGQTVFSVSLDSPDTAAWYGLLVGCAVAALAIAALVGVCIAARKGKLWQKEKK